MKIAFVVPWYGEIPGGAESECKNTAENLSRNGIEVEILTTCVKEFNSDWNSNYYEEGVSQLKNVTIRRFKVRQRNIKLFDRVNSKLMHNQKISAKEEQIYIEEMINSDDLCHYIDIHGSDYNYFLFIPYMFGTTYYGSQIHPKKSFLIPCLHDESYAYMDIYKNMFQNVAGLIYHAEPEAKLANEIFDIKGKQIILGEGIDTNISFEAKRFREKYGIHSDFILYAGRREPGKNTPLLIDFFCKYKLRNQNELKLVLIGSGEVSIPEKFKKEILDLGFVQKQDKYDAFAAASLLCQPSINESFSIVIMESWLCLTPVLVHSGCAVTKNHCIKGRSGLYFKNFEEFEGCINFYLNNPLLRRKMAINGKKYVDENFNWDRIVEKYVRFLEEA
ncbi:glycosyltransferase family 4 protein [Methanosarcina sp. UBA5]|uniref:glycosyltransferase family 4 protein n=1 Tax=Methanosarcina sp. UBA5 TaxID=1915593 RepID=UPI0025FFC248|nr:glycosyltransferase family 4 protein [Methanosarcina sp. UBA5]